MEHTLLLLCAGFLAGAMNAAAGGGSFVTLPVLLGAGLDPVTANASSTVALFPGGLGGAVAYRKELRHFAVTPLSSLTLASLAGGLAGAVLLVATPGALLLKAIPWLMLAGSVAFASGGGKAHRANAALRLPPRAVLCCQFVLGIYGGYFGGAVGLMMMAVWSLLGVTDIVAMNAAKTVLVAAANCVAVVFFAAAGVVAWSQAMVVLAAALAGGYAGARAALLAPAPLLRRCITACNFIMTALTFAKAYL